MCQQRHDYKHQLSPDRRERLNRIGFDWETATERFERLWNEMFERLKAYRLDNGNCHVPQHYEDDPSLGIWVACQRVAFNKGRLSEHRLVKLRSIQFNWGKTLSSGRDESARDVLWMEYYKQLARFQQKHGHCLVATTYRQGKDRALGTWICKQRLAFFNGDLPDYRRNRLDELGFVYKVEPGQACQRSPLVKDRQWNRCYRELRCYIKEHGHADVPWERSGLSACQGPRGDSRQGAPNGWRR